MFVSEGLAARKVTGVVFLGLGGLAIVALLVSVHGVDGGGNFAVMLKQLLEELGTQDADLG